MLLKRYVTFQWIKIFFLTFMACFLLITVATMVNGMTRTSVTLLQVLKNFLAETPKWFLTISPIGCLLASLFTIERLRSSSELVALFASGFSRRTLAITIIQASLGIMVIQFMMDAYVGPSLIRYQHAWIDKTKVNFKKETLSHSISSLKEGGRIWFRGPGLFFSYIGQDKEKKQIASLELNYLKEGPGEHQIVKIIHAAKATYLKENLWHLDGVTTFSELETRSFPKVSFFDTLEIPFNLGPEDLKKIEAEVSTLFFVDLYRYIQQLRKTDINPNEYLIILYLKFSRPLFCLIFALVPVALLKSPNRRGNTMSFNFTLAIVFAFIFWFLSSTLEALGANQKIPATLAVFGLPVIILVFILGLFLKNRKLR